MPVGTAQVALQELDKSAYVKVWRLANPKRRVAIDAYRTGGARPPLDANHFGNVIVLLEDIRRAV